MAQLWKVFLVFTTIALNSRLHMSSSMSLTSTSTITILSGLNNATDLHALLSFKSKISNNSRKSMAFWNDSVHFCQWPGIICGGHRHPQRVISLNLSSLELAGLISTSIVNLTFLKRLDVSNNKFHGSIPQEIGRLFRLQHLNLSMNSLQGGIPATLSGCSRLQTIDIGNNMLEGEIPPNLSDSLDLQLISLRNNSFTGYIPPSLANLSALSVLDLAKNNLSGTIPTTVGNLVSLSYLSLASNQLSGCVPTSLVKLSNLSKLDLSHNNLTGVLPLSLWNLSSLSHLALSYNSLSGSLPPNAFEAFPLLERLFLNDNQFHGSIPMSLSNASRLSKVALSVNRFSNTIPSTLGNLHNLQFLDLYRNLLEAKEPHGWDFLTALTNCTDLKVLKLDCNNLGGTLPNSMANLSSKLQQLTMVQNEITGSLSPDIGNLLSLEIFQIAENFLVGSIPSSIGMLSNLHMLELNINNLTGEIPSSIGNLSQLNSLFLDFNDLSGIIPAALGNCQALNVLNLQSNKLTGAIPKEIFTISSLTTGLGLASNSLTGPVPSEIGSLTNVEIIDLSENQLSGEIPYSLGECQVLGSLILHNNFFQGSIPSSFSALLGLFYIDLSQNNLSGKIPDFLQDFRAIEYLNLSYNNFEGEVPKEGVFRDMASFSLLGNKKLCGGNPEMHLPACLFQSQKKKHNSTKIAVAISISGVFLCFLLLLCFIAGSCWIQKSKRKSLASTFPNGHHTKVSYAELRRATAGFSTDNLIGSGSFGTVYKGILDDMKVVAVKVLDLQVQGASKSFMSECKALRNIRHRNLVKIITVCSSTDFRGNDFKAVVFEFMANRSLDDWLHPKEEECELKKLNLMQRMNIAIDVASALDYLHHLGETPIIYCDLKPSNILLDDNMTAHVGDFGLAKFLKKKIIKSSQHSSSSIGLKGTVGYIAPEYGMANKVSTQGDVYSYGILLLEMFTGMKPTDDMFNEGQSLRKFVELAYQERIMDIIDADLLLLEEDGYASENAQNIKLCRIVDCVASMFRIGIQCSTESPTERMDMGEIISELHKIRDEFLKNEAIQENQS